jgi:hypothetical protein
MQHCSYVESYVGHGVGLATGAPPRRFTDENEARYSGSAYKMYAHWRLSLSITRPYGCVICLRSSGRAAVEGARSGGAVV